MVITLVAERLKDLKKDIEELNTKISQAKANGNKIEIRINENRLQSCRSLFDTNLHIYKFIGGKSGN